MSILRIVPRLLLVPVIGLGIAGCTDWPSQVSPSFRVLSMDIVASGIERPLLVTAPAWDQRLFVVQRNGVIRILRGETVAERPFLDLSALVSTVGWERGMLGMAFHPNYSENGRFYVSFTAHDGTIRLSEFRRSAGDPDAADISTRRDLLSIPTPGVQHFGGMLQFTPEGDLLMSVGEGGAYTDPGGESQNPGSLLGKLLRISVDAGDPYGIPATNPFVGQPDVRPEIWASGLRNPWRFAIDAQARTLYVADVGENSYEEINIVPLDTAGLNYGWSFFEGRHCQYALDHCESGTYHQPEVVYEHLPPCTSVTGGFVYRGTRYPEHIGRYFYADYCLGWIRSLRFVGGIVTETIDWAPTNPAEQIASFGEDGAGELYAVSLKGRIFRIGAEVPPAR